MASPSGSNAASAVPTRWGWNYDLTDPTVTSPFPTEANYFSEPGALLPGASHWTIAIESENGPGDSAPGPACQSFPINDITGAPNSIPGVAMLQWAPHVDETGTRNWAVELKTDLYDNPHPAGAGYFTWYAFGENVDLGGGPLPEPDTAAFDVDLLYKAWLPDAGARVSVVWQGYWNGESHQIEIDLSRQSGAWGANTGDLVQNVRITPGLTFLQLNGAALGLDLIPDVNTHVHVEWHSIVQTLIDRGLIDAPAGGWSNSVSQAFYVSTELANQSATHAGIADLWLDDFRISASTAATPSSTTPLGVSPADPAAGMYNVTTYGSGTVVTNSLTGDIVQTLPPTATDRLQFLTLANVTFATNLTSARTLGLDPTLLRDFDGNQLGGAGQWELKGLASLRPGATPSYILANPNTGRWAEAAVHADGSINFANNGQNGDTRVVGLYRDPLVDQGIVKAGGPEDSQVRFLADIKGDRLAVLGSVFDQEAGTMDLMFKLTNHAADHHDDVYLRAILHDDGNIQYANYMNATQLTQWMGHAGIAPAVYSGWLTQM